MQVATTPAEDTAAVSRSLETRARASAGQSNPLVRAKDFQTLMGEVDDLERMVSEQRDLAVFAAHESGISYPRLAAELGISKSRVQQLVNNGRTIAARRAAEG